MIPHSEMEHRLAKDMAISVNGGSWNKDYTDAQKSGWILKVRWALNNLKSDQLRQDIF